MSERNGSRATAAEFVRAFSHWRMAAAEQPVFITNHGRETHVVLDIGAYDEIVAKASATTSDDGIAGVADWIDAALVLCDHEMRVCMPTGLQLRSVASPLPTWWAVTLPTHCQPWPGP